MNPINPMHPTNEKPPLTLRVKNRRLLAILLSVIGGLVVMTVILIAFVFPRRHGRIPRNAREAVLGIQQPPVESSPASLPDSAGSTPAPAPSPASGPAQ